MDRTQEIEVKLWEYIDGLSAPSEKTAIEKLIAENGDWRAKYEELLDTHQLISAAELEAPSMRFTKNVMEQIANHQVSPATRTYINQRVIWGISAFFLTVILVLLVYVIGSIDWSSSALPKENALDFSRVNYSSFFNHTFFKIFMMLNIVLGLMLFDRYLVNKRNRLLQKI